MAVSQVSILPSGSFGAGMDLAGSEAKELGSLAKESGIDKAIGRGTQSLTLW